MGTVARHRYSTRRMRSRPARVSSVVRRRRAAPKMPDFSQIMDHLADAAIARGVPTGRDMTETRAATTLGIPQPKLSKMLREQFRGFSERKLMGDLTQLG